MPRQDLRDLHVPADAAAVLCGLIFGGISTVACFTALWGDSTPYPNVANVSGLLAAVLFTIAGVSMVRRLKKLADPIRRIRLLIGVAVGFIVLVIDVGAGVLVEMYMPAGPLHNALIIAILALGLGGAGMIAIVRAMIV